MSLRSPRRSFHKTMLAAALAACSLANLSAAHAQTMHKVRYEEVVRSVLYVPMYVGLKKGMFKDQGIELTMKTSQGTDKGMAALLSGSADIVLIGPEASIYVANSASRNAPCGWRALGLCERAAQPGRGRYQDDAQRSGRSEADQHRRELRFRRGQAHAAAGREQGGR